MNMKDIKELAQIMEKTGLTSIVIREKNLSIELKKEVQMITARENMTSFVSSISPISAQTQTISTASLEEATFSSSNYKEIVSPMVGVFYEAPSPDAEPYVQVGDKVAKGKTLCIIEAMKLLNEIPADCDGEIVEICVKNGDVVEFGQTLYKIS